MSVAYSQNAAYDYRRFEETADGWQPVETVAQPRPASRHAVFFRRALVLVSAIVAATVCIGLLYMKAQVFKAQRDVNDIRKQIVAADKLNSTLNEQLSEAMNVNTIMEKAAALGMGYPDGSQVLYVSLDDNGTSIKK